jgi:AmiR/NasT family two-component response regulator
MLRVMIMDDSADSQRPSLYLRLMLEEVGYVVVAEVFESRKIYEAVKSRKPDVIIIDTESSSRDTLECRRRLNFDQGGCGVAADARDLAGFGLDQDAAADAAVATG